MDTANQFTRMKWTRYSQTKRSGFNLHRGLEITHHTYKSIDRTGHSTTLPNGILIDFVNNPCQLTYIQEFV